MINEPVAGEKFGFWGSNRQKFVVTLFSSEFFEWIFAGNNCFTEVAWNAYYICQRIILSDSL